MTEKTDRGKLPETDVLGAQLLSGGVRVVGERGDSDLEMMLREIEPTRPMNGEFKYTLLIQNRDTVVSRVRATIAALKLPVMLVGLVDSYRELNPHYASLLDKVVSITPSPDGTTPFLDPMVAVHLKEILGVTHVYSGWGFLAENSQAIKTWEDHGLVHVGPTSNTVYMLGDKIQFRRICHELSIPITPGTIDYVASVEDAEQEFRKLGGSIRIKAASGGGGMGQFEAKTIDDVGRAYRLAVTTAHELFKDGNVYIEKSLGSDDEILRHVEVQFLGDGKGRIEIYGDRDCSVQDKNKKMIEIARADFIDQKTRNSLYKYTKKIAERLNYRGAGTCEFLVTQNNESGTYGIYALEINARLQVEHPITEAITNIDLVHEQLKVAMPGLGELQSMRGRKKPGLAYAMELRVLAEYLDSGKYIPCPGKITSLDIPGLPYLRVESAVVEGSEICPHFDSTIMRLIISGRTMEELFRNGREVVNHVRIEGLRETTLDNTYRPLFNNPDAVNKMLKQQYGLNNLVGILPHHKK